MIELKNEWTEVADAPDPEWEEFQKLASDDSYQLRVCTGHDGHYMMIKIDQDGTRHNYGHSNSTTVEGAQAELIEITKEAT